MIKFATGILSNTDLTTISQHITYLLLTCRKVCIPGLGTFFALAQSASFDTFYGVFYPSKLRICFSNSVNDNSSELIDSLKRKLNINQEEAQEMVNNFVADITRKLKKSKYCRIQGIGYLISDKNNNLLFKDTFWKRRKTEPFSLMIV